MDFCGWQRRSWEDYHVMLRIDTTGKSQAKCVGGVHRYLCYHNLSIDNHIMLFIYDRSRTQP